MKTLNLNLLGGFQVSLNDVAYSGFPSRKGAALLYYLAITARPQARSTLATLLWSEIGETKARNNLRVTLSQMRADFGDHLLITRDTIALNVDAPHHIDVHQFSSLLHSAYEVSPPHTSMLRAASKLYQGELLEGFHVSDAYSFEEWLAGQRERLRQQALQALHDLGVSAVEQRDYAAGIDYLTQLLTLDPWREETHRQLMLLLARSGQRDAALAQYERCRRILQEELAVEPEDETTALRQQIYDHIIVVYEPPSAGPQHQLPIYPTALRGRDEDLAQLAATIDDPTCRLVTLYGVGGIGKTRLALALATMLTPTYTHGAVFVPLATIRDPQLVLGAIAQALGVRESPDRRLVEHLAEYMAPKHLLLVLDNFEQVVDAAPLVAQLLSLCAHLKIVVTSREILHLRGEHEYHVPPLPVPSHVQWTSEIENIAAFPAVALFAERAWAVQPRFELTADNAGTVVDICAQLEGIPLAIELAAARIRMMSPQTLARRLTSRLQALAHGARDVPERHRTLRDTIRWSYELLDKEEQTLFGRLSIFAGGFTLEAAEAVGSGDHLAHIDGQLYPLAVIDAHPLRPLQSVLDLLESLVSKSLVEQQAGLDGEPRFRMLETVREYACECVSESGEFSALRHQHAQFYLTLAEKAEPELQRWTQVHWLNRLEVEHDNLREALRWAQEQRSGLVMMRLASALRWFWYTHGHLREGRLWLQAASHTANSDTPTALRSKVLHAEGFLAHYQYDFDHAQMVQAEALRLGRESDDALCVANALYELGGIAHVRDDYTCAQPLYDESLRIFERIGNEIGAASALYRLGNLRERQDLEQSIALYQESLKLSRTVGDYTTMASTLVSLGEVAQLQGHLDDAARFYEEALVLYRAIQHKHGIAWAVSKMGHIALHAGDYNRAVAMYEEGLALAHALGSKLAISYGYRDLANAARKHGDRDVAEKMYAEALAVILEIKPEVVAECLEGLALVAAEEVAHVPAPRSVERAERAALMWGVAHAIRESINAPLMLEAGAETGPLLLTVRGVLGPQRFATAWAHGHAMTARDAARQLGVTSKPLLAA